jgi:flavin reductase (DIM6/NTAB) family NADH-FMN oxidoreductase RutF
MEKHLTKIQLSQLEQRFRTNLINSIGGFKSLCLIGTADYAGQTNLAIFNSIVHIGANPPYIGFIVRPDSVERHTLSNILDIREYTINHVNADIFQKAHQTAARYPKLVSEFEATGLTSDFKNDFRAPYVKESLIQLGVQFKERINIPLNGTILIVGEIMHIYFPETCLVEDGFLDIEKAGSITCVGLDSYHTTTRLARLSYAKPDKIAIAEPLKYLEERKN